MAQTKNPKITEEELKAGGEVLGRKLAFLIVNLFPNEEEQKGMMALAQAMSPQQLLEYSEILESKYIEAYGHALEQDFAKEVKELKDEYIAEEAQADQQAIDELDKLEKEIDNLNKKE